MITPIHLPMANAYLVTGRQPVLIDTGAPGDTGRIVAALAAAGLQPGDLSLILLTHAHGDHAGSAAELQALSGAPLAVHPADAALLAAGHNDLLKPTNLEARLLRRFVDQPFPATQADLFLSDGQSLTAFGLAAQVMHTPGHTPGSVSLMFDDGAAIVGDLLMGGYMGGRILSHHPRQHYFAANPTQLPASLSRVLGQNPHTLYVGHGGPLEATAVRSCFGADLPLAFTTSGVW